MNEDITVVMTYWNRKKQLLKTLESIKHNVKIIIVDDCSTDGEDITYLNSENIKIITLKDKTWINPCIPFNIGFKEVQTDIVILQNAECLHIGDIIQHTLDNIKDGIYLNYSALSIDENLTKRINDGENVQDVIKPILNNRIMEHGGNGWYNHSIYRSEALNFCSSIKTKNLYELGGFDERFGDGFGYDDFDFINRVRKKLKVQIIDNPFVIHQHHPYFTNDNFWELYKKNEILLKDKDNDYDVKKYNTIYK